MNLVVLVWSNEVDCCAGCVTFGHPPNNISAVISPCIKSLKKRGKEWSNQTLRLGSVCDPAPKGRVLCQLWYLPMSKTILLDLNSCFNKKNCRYKILPRHMWCFRDASSEVLCLWFQCLIKSNLISCTWPKPFFKPIPFLVVVHLRSHLVVLLFKIII